jgi:hypothetical protein
MCIRPKLDKDVDIGIRAKMAPCGEPKTAISRILYLRQISAILSQGRVMPEGRLIERFVPKIQTMGYVIGVPRPSR